MGDRTKIEWSDATWTPVRARNLQTGARGWHCEHKSTGCQFCYAENMNRRIGTGLDFKPGHRADVEIYLDDKLLGDPLRWKRPRMIFVCSMTDLFADFVPDAMIDKVFAVMAATPRHTYQVLTKRIERARVLLPNILLEPLPNVWMGTSVENQETVHERVGTLANRGPLLETMAAVRFISVEPLLESVAIPLEAIDWVICGGESGPKARPMDIDWARSLRDQCALADVPFFMKQLGGKRDKRDKMKDFPEGLRVREMPKAAAPVAT